MLYVIGDYKKYDKCFVWDTDDFTLEIVNSIDILNCISNANIDISMLKLSAYKGVYRSSNILYTLDDVLEATVAYSDNRWWLLEVKETRQANNMFKLEILSNGVSVFSIILERRKVECVLLPVNNGISLVINYINKKNLNAYTIPYTNAKPIFNSYNALLKEALL